MKAVFGVISLLAALAIVGLVAIRQLDAVGKTDVDVAAAARVRAVPQISGSGTVREPARALQDNVASEAIKAVNQGAEARREQADKP